MRPVRLCAGLFVSEYLLQPVYHVSLEFGALDAMKCLCRAENDDYSLGFGIGYSFGRFITYRQQHRKPRQVPHRRENVFTFDLCG